MSCFLEKHMSEDNKIVLPCLTDMICSKVVGVEFGLDHLKFKNSKNGAEMLNFWPKIEFHKCLFIFGQYLLNFYSFFPWGNT